VTVLSLSLSLYIYIYIYVYIIVDPHLLDLGTSWKLVVRFTPPLYLRGKGPRYRGIGGWVGLRVGKMKNPMTSSGTEPATFRLAA
jgi:hypothetical protein